MGGHPPTLHLLRPGVGRPALTRQDLHVGQLLRLKATARSVRVLRIMAMGLGFSPTLAMVEVEVVDTGEQLTVESTALIHAAK